MFNELDSFDCIEVLLEIISVYTTIRSLIRLSLSEIPFVVINIDDVKSSPKIPVLYIDFERFIVAGVILQGN